MKKRPHVTILKDYDGLKGRVLPVEHRTKQHVEVRDGDRRIIFTPREVGKQISK